MHGDKEQEAIFKVLNLIPHTKKNFREGHRFMKLIRLHLQGFKSFKDRTTINFDEGITGIVGPNGCGKSNIVDALFWVMGEQSAKHLRGNKMKDLIFAGSSKYSPAGFAEVTLVQCLLYCHFL